MSVTPNSFHPPVSIQLIADRLGPGLLALMEALRRLAPETSHGVYLVGGPLRDAVLEAPLRDLDFSVVGDAPALAAALARDLDGRLIVHPRFRTATVELGDAQIDLVTARKEVYPRQGSLPEITPGSIGDDLARRDFSINAMALPIWGTGELLDPHGGLTDIAHQRVRALHDGSFFDDPTRMLRAVRYEQRFGFCLEEATMRQLRDALSAGVMSLVSSDRWRHELDRIVEEDRPGRALARASDLGLLTGIHPALGAEATSDALARIAGAAEADAGAFLSALVYNVTAADGEGITHRLNLPNRQAKLVRDTIWLRERESLLASVAATPSKLAGLLAGIAEDAVTAVAVLTGDVEVSRGLAGHLANPGVSPRLTGTDLIEMGMREGPGVGKVLARLRDANLDGLASTAAEELSLARTLISEQGNGL